MVRPQGSHVEAGCDAASTGNGGGRIALIGVSKRPATSRGKTCTPRVVSFQCQVCWGALAIRAGRQGASNRRRPIKDFSGNLDLDVEQVLPHARWIDSDAEARRLRGSHLSIAV